MVIFYKSSTSIGHQEEDEEEKNRNFVPHTGKIVPQWGNITVLRTTDSKWEKSIKEEMISNQHRPGVLLFVLPWTTLRV